MSNMKEVIRKEILHDLSQVSIILKVKESRDIEELKSLSEHAIENIALHKDLELVSVTVFIYSIYKIIHQLSMEDHVKLVKYLDIAVSALNSKNFGKYNSAMKSLYAHVKKSNAKIKVHFQDVMDAARIRKGSSLLQHGLSIGQAAGLMGLSNWDLQAYAGKNVVLEKHTETISAKRRFTRALGLFQ
jgi:hypothetical protein